MSAIRTKIFYPMSPEQEEGYTLVCAERILRYNGFFLLAVIGIQIYNLIYALVYTGGKLHTVSSRVYTAFYSVLLIISAAGLVLKNYLKRKLPDQAESIVRLQVLYGFFLMAWGACVTIYDQRVSDNISVYLIISLTVAMLVYFTPLQAVVGYTFFLFMLYLMIPVFQKLPEDNYGSRVNMAVMTLMAVFICIYRNTSDRKHYLDQEIIMEQNRRLADEAGHDSLTRLRNRRFFDVEMNNIYQQCVESGTVITVMMIDIDEFKLYNDTYGHQQGDECLRRMAWRLEQELDKEYEYLIRYGGEEFLYIGIGVDKQTALEQGEKFNKVIRELVIGPSEQDSRSITISIGIYSSIPSGQCRWADYIARADKALYIAKDSGRDRSVSL